MIDLIPFFLGSFSAGFAGHSSSGYEKSKDGVVVQLDSGSLRLRVCDERIIHVVYTPTGSSAARPSLVVNKAWESVKWNLERGNGTVTLLTSKLKVEVNIAAGAITFYDKSGATVLRENPERPREMAPSVVQGEKTYHGTQRFVLTKDEGLYGLGQYQAGVMNYRNHDVTLIQNNRFVVVPFLVSTKNYGILWDNYSHTDFHDGQDGMTFWSEVADVIDYYFILGSNMDDVVGGYRVATGSAPMFPKWVFGYWQSKERYKSRDELMSVVREYRERKIPIDNIVQDWQYWGKLGWNAMKFDEEVFPKAKEMIDEIHNKYHMQLMVSVWPQVGPTTPLYKELESKGHIYPTEVWNGGKTYDAYSSEARQLYWKFLNDGLFSIGVDAWWMDATEPESKWCYEQMEAKAGIMSNGKTALGSASRYLNTYPLMTTGGVYENQRKTNPKKRVFILTRSAFAGQQRYSTAIWSGDVAADWKVFKNQISGGLNFCMAGIPYWTSDIGAFFPSGYGGKYPRGFRDDAYKEFYVRWFQFGAFCPLFRAHGTGTPREVWQFGEPGSWAYDILLKYINLRYRLMPYIYSVAWKVTDEHYTMMRGLAMDFSSDKKVLNIDGEYLFGPAFLVAPVTAEMYHPRCMAVAIPAEDLLNSNDEKGGLIGEYFKGTRFDKSSVTRTDKSIYFNWAKNFLPEVGEKNFSVRWTGKLLTKESGEHEFETTTAGGVRVWINNVLLIDKWYHSASQTDVGVINLEGATKYDMKIEFYDEIGTTSFRFTWRTPSMIAHKKPQNKVQSTKVYLPQSADWFDFWTGQKLTAGKAVEKMTPLDIMPLYIKTGSIVPMGPELQHSAEKPADPIEVRIYSGANGGFNLYEDEGDNYNYEKGTYSVIPLSWDENTKTLTMGRRKGKFPGMLEARTFEIVLVEKDHGVGVKRTASPDKAVKYTGGELKIRLGHNGGQ